MLTLVVGCLLTSHTHTHRGGGPLKTLLFHVWEPLGLSFLVLETLGPILGRHAVRPYFSRICSKCQTNDYWLILGVSPKKYQTNVPEHSKMSKKCLPGLSGVGPKKYKKKVPGDPKISKKCPGVILKCPGNIFVDIFGCP